MPQLSIEQRLFVEPYAFDFFQAVRLLQRLRPEAVPLGREGPPEREVVRLRALPSLAFPASALYSLSRPNAEQPFPTAVVAFMGLHGPSGVLPRHYTELILRLERDQRGEERRALRDWFDLFNHRFLSLFYRAWEKYRFWIDYERGGGEDLFTRALFSLAGLGTQGLRNRLRVEVAEPHSDSPRVLAQVVDLGLLRYAGLLATRRRTAAGLQALLHDYFHTPVRIEQFVGQWLVLEPENRSCLGLNATLGIDAVAGERVRDHQGRFRVTLGPLDYAGFREFFPDRSGVPEGKGFWLLCHLTRLYVGLELDFEIRLILRADAVPECLLCDEANGGLGARLGWNTWLISQEPAHDVDDAVFEGSAVRRFDASE
ncbi:MAG: type VI secretion system baseplate subunit TssG [Gemmataceae bacterium]